MISGGAALYALNNRQSQDKSETSVASTTNDTREKSDTEKMYETYSGEEYDRYFIATMLEHHQGAIDMAELAVTNAGHQELKDMADAIVTAQSNEIDQMKTWQKEWGYSASYGEQMIDHSGMNMMDDMVAMMNELEGKTGDDFDKLFLSLMIEHHKGAIDMARPGLKNAYHQEIKDLAGAVVNEQSAEIEQMKTWQKEWGYEQ